MNRLFIILGTIGLFAFVLAVGLSKINFNSFRRWIPPQWKNFKDLDTIDRTILEYDSVYGDYLQWTGKRYLGPGSPDSITRKLLLDKSHKFAIKGIIKDTTGFFTKIPGDIHFSGRWTEKNDILTLRFYFSPETWYQLFDSLKNDNILKIIDPETIQIDRRAETIWIMNTECKTVK